MINKSLLKKIRFGVLLAVIVSLGLMLVFNSADHFTIDNVNENISRQHVILNGKSIKNGDIIFHSSLTSQSRAIQLATQSKYSHCGIIFIENGSLYVLEAVQPVKKTPIVEWINRGKNNHYVIKRLNHADKVLNDSILFNMYRIGKSFVGKDYDYAFSWSDDRIYCSELVWKVYKRGAGIKLSKLNRLKSFDLSDPEVSSQVKERYGTNIPFNELVVSPAAIFESELLQRVE